MDDWLKIAISAGIGAAFGVAAEPFKRIVTDHFSRRRLQRSVYYEISHMYRAIAVLVGYGGADYNNYETVFKEVQKELAFTNYKHLRSRPDLFYDIPQFAAIDSIYHAFERLTQHPGQYNWASYSSSARYALNLVEQKIANTEIDVEILLKICPENLRERFEELAYGQRQPFWDEALKQAKNAVPEDPPLPRDWPPGFDLFRRRRHRPG
jgi:hypothetical protein